MVSRGSLWPWINILGHSWPSCSKTPGLLANQGCVPSVALRGHTEGFVSSYLSQYLLCVTAARTLMESRRQNTLQFQLPALQLHCFNKTLQRCDGLIDQLLLLFYESRLKVVAMLTTDAHREAAITPAFCEGNCENVPPILPPLITAGRSCGEFLWPSQARDDHTFWFALTFSAWKLNVSGKL